MNTKDKLQILNTAIQELMELYRILDGELPQLHFVGAPVPANSEVKKMAVTF